DYPSVIPLLPLRNGVLFPGTVITVPVGRARSIAMIEDVGQDAIVGIAVQRDARMVDPELADLQPVGTYARVRQVRRTGDRNYQVVLEGLARFSLTTILHGKPYWTAEVQHLPDENAEPTEAKLLAAALAARMREKLQEIAPDMSASFGQWIELL